MPFRPEQFEKWIPGTGPGMTGAGAAALGSYSAAYGASGNSHHNADFSAEADLAMKASALGLALFQVHQWMTSAFFCWAASGPAKANSAAVLVMR